MSGLRDSPRLTCHFRRRARDHRELWASGTRFGKITVVRSLLDCGPEGFFTDVEDYVAAAITDVVSNTAGQISIKSEQQAAAPTLSVE